MNVIKTMIIMNKLMHLYKEIFEDRHQINVLDAGCGEGAGLIGTYFVLKNSKRLFLAGLDVSTTMLKKGRYILRNLLSDNQRVQVKLQQTKISDRIFKKTRRKFDVVLFSNSLSEITPPEEIPVRFIEQALRCTSDHGLLVIIEPALKIHSRRLMVLRDELIRQKRAHVLLPCLHDQACPVVGVRKGKEWCHLTVPWTPPEYMSLLNKKLNREIHQLKLSYLVVSKRKHRRFLDSGFLVISSLLKEKGKKRCFLCSPHGRIELIRLDRLKHPLNAAFDSICKGTIVGLDNTEQKKHSIWQITENTRVSILYRCGENPSS